MQCADETRDVMRLHTSFQRRSAVSSAIDDVHLDGDAPRRHEIHTDLGRDVDGIDHAEKVFHPELVPGEAAPPTVLQLRKKVTFELRTGEPTGEGLMR